MQNNIDWEINEFGRRAGVEISMFEGASVITTNEDVDIWLECPLDSALVVIHTSIQENVNSGTFGPQALNQMLTLNGQIDKMKGAWTAAHEATNSIRLCFAIPKECTTADILEQVFTNMIELRNEVKEIVH
ncbi:type III secretion system chaperone [Agarilytica rhodophyticola]|uniref:type III secretion system chaperone n=1 Tax=Agarilytica rhodophyticola TaxID=1737490 RepID=UPI000B345322|nr:type III secretion system chaperone [Agarilytica rhodophyticola]